MKRKLDRLVQQVYVKLHPTCLVCGDRTSEMHHYIKKSQSLWLRWEGKNLIPLCKICHCKLHTAGDPRINQEIIKVKGHKWADNLERERRVMFKANLTNLQLIYEELISS